MYALFRVILKVTFFSLREGSKALQFLGPNSRAGLPILFPLKTCKMSGEMFGQERGFEQQEYRREISNNIYSGMAQFRMQKCFC